MGDITPVLPSHCLNCDTELQGQWCHHCGQKARSEVRHFGSVFTDILDTVFEYDNRIWRTLVPLYFKPGRLTRDYMAGKRARYVLPFRLFFVLSIVSFLALQLLALPDEVTELSARANYEIFAELETADAVIAERDRLISEIQQSLTQLEAGSVDGGGLAGNTLRSARDGIETAARSRLEELGVTTEPPAIPPPEPVTPQEPAETGLPDTTGESAEDSFRSELQIDWLPQSANQWLNAMVERGVGNLEQVNQDPGRLIDAMFSLLPIVLFCMLPIFALLLKLFYVFSGRMYMEHFVVALHSHSFLFMALLIGLLLNWVSGLPPAGSFLDGVLSTIGRVATVWAPLYLLLMQRTVYGQGWDMTVAKYLVIGVLYFMLLAMALLTAALLSLVSL
ncbi:DUF3667 domain-containing protein [Pseudohongiella sp. SYSU M77423]|uniref:DUF3667 domain-containing protein n=1 Tax=Pseudohongiella sp. SYSU M77423 TaxID=3042312 RepID=UPI0024805148|nr:DUF3667 domain-containing protein [Pseudohongiella sp. SYSU M77423]MDH7944531.1 DUF3667 domain-containing protein [Pseudohongiella sp. SYSU M77423]